MLLPRKAEFGLLPPFSIEEQGYETSYDPATDAMLLRFSENEIIESEERVPGIIFDLDADGRLVGIEILDAKDKLSKNLDLSTITTAA